MLRASLYLSWLGWMSACLTQTAACTVLEPLFPEFGFFPLPGQGRRCRAPDPKHHSSALHNPILCFLTVHLRATWLQ